MLRSGWKKMNDKIKYIGPNFLELLTLVFIVLKLLGKINWSLWWVLSPIWLSWGIAIIVAIVLIVHEKNDGF